MRRSQEGTAVVTESVHFFKVQHEHFYPCPRSWQAQTTMKCTKYQYSRTSPVQGRLPQQKLSTSVSLWWCFWCLVQLGRMRGLSDLMCQSQTEHNFFTDAIDFREFLSNKVYQTYHCLHLRKTGSFLATLICYLKLPYLKPHTRTHKQARITVTWLVSTYAQGSCCHYDVGAFLNNSFVVFHVVVQLCSTIQSPPQSTMQCWCSQTSAHCCPPVLPVKATSTLPLGEQHSKKNSKALVTKCLLTRCPNAASQ